MRNEYSIVAKNLLPSRRDTTFLTECRLQPTVNTSLKETNNPAATQVRFEEVVEFPSTLQSYGCTSLSSLSFEVTLDAERPERIQPPLGIARTGRVLESTRIFRGIPWLSIPHLQFLSSQSMK